MSTRPTYASSPTRGVGVTEKRTPALALRIRITATPDPELFAEYDVERLRLGDVYEVPVRLATLLIISGYAESAAGRVLPAAEAADFSGRNPPDRRRRSG